MDSRRLNAPITTRFSPLLSLPFSPLFSFCVEAAGDILVFLTGEQEIEDAVRKLQDQADSLGPEYGPMMCVPLYSTLPPRAQQKIFDPAPPPRRAGGPPGRKVIVSTNIAETSLVRLHTHSRAAARSMESLHPRIFCAVCSPVSLSSQLISPFLRQSTASCMWSIPVSASRRYTTLASASSRCW